MDEKAKKQYSYSYIVFSYRQKRAVALLCYIIINKECRGQKVMKSRNDFHERENDG